MTTKTATMETITRRANRAYRAAGAPTKREIARQQAAMDAEIARMGRMNEIAAEQADEMAAARRSAADRIAEAFAPLAAAAAEVVMIAAASAEEPATLEDVAKAASTQTMKFRVWRGAKETRVYVEGYNGSRGRPWIAKGFYAVDEDRRTSRCECDRRGPVEEFEAALAAFLAA